MALAGWLARCPLIAILRGVKTDEVLAIAAALEHQGIAIVEVPLNSPQPIESIALLRREFGQRLLIGAGTVMTVDQVAEIAGVGGRLIVTPHADAAIVQAAKRHGLFAVPGFFTPTEAFAMLEVGADALKLFPAEAASPAVLRALRAVLPSGTGVLPVGGIDASNIAPWLEAGAAGCGIGSAIYRPGDKPETVAAKAHRLVSALAKWTRQERSA
jgi:2-dehydro-3-deoxyphosphogalactonate aldolase